MAFPPETPRAETFFSVLLRITRIMITTTRSAIFSCANMIINKNNEEDDSNANEYDRYVFLGAIMTITKTTRGIVTGPHRGLPLIMHPSNIHSTCSAGASTGSFDFDISPSPVESSAHIHLRTSDMNTVSSRVPTIQCPIRERFFF